MFADNLRTIVEHSQRGSQILPELSYQHIEQANYFGAIKRTAIGSVHDLAKRSKERVERAFPSRAHPARLIGVTVVDGLTPLKQCAAHAAINSTRILRKSVRR